MDQKEAKIPKIRFKKFVNTNAWEQRKLSDMAKYRNGKAHENDIEIGGNYIVINSKFVSTDGNVKKFTNQQIEPVFRDELAFVLSDVPNGRAIARTFLIDEDDKYTLNQRIAGITPSQNTYSYFLHVLMNRNKYFLKFDDGSKQTNLSKSDVENWLGYYPDIQEQTKIGAFFQELDNLIAIHQRKLEKIIDIKKAYLSEMFPAEGECIPRKRFPEFTDDWEQRKLGEYTSLITKGTTPKNQINGVVNFIKVENISNGNIKPISKISMEEHEGYLKRSKLEANDILFSIAGTLGRTAIINEEHLPANTNQALAIIRGYDFDVNFLITSLNGRVVEEYIRKNPTIGAQPNLSLEQVKNLHIWTPNPEEQLRIGAFFQEFDNLIAIHQRNIEKLQNLKKAYLINMFV